MKLGRGLHPPQPAAPWPQRFARVYGWIRWVPILRRGISNIEFIADFEDHRLASAVEEGGRRDVGPEPLGIDPIAVQGRRVPGFGRPGLNETRWHGGCNGDVRRKAV